MGVITLTVPDGREACVAWLQTQTPEVVANLLECTQRLHSIPACATGANLNVALEELRADVAAQFRQQMQVEAEQHESHVSILQTQLDCSKRDSERVKKELESIADSTSATLDKENERFQKEKMHIVSQLDEALAVANQLRSEQAIFQTSAREENDARLLASREDYEARIAQQHVLFEQQVGHLKQHHEGELARFQTLLEQERTQNRSLQEGPVAKMETLMTSLCGHSQKKGEIGETFVKQVHDGLNLGVLTNTSHIKQSGMADSTWNHAHPNSEPLCAMVEVKFATTGDSTRDIDKFMKDLDVSVRAKEKNAALYISLIGPIAGKSRIALEMIHGVPVMWASRLANDENLSAWTLVEMAFVQFAAIWPIVSANNSGAGTADQFLRHVSSLLQVQLDEYDRLEPRISFLERTSETMRREAAMLRKTRDALVTHTTNFQSRNSLTIITPSTADVNEDDVLQAIRSYHKRTRGYYPKQPNDLKNELAPEILRHLAVHTDLFQSCERRVRAEKQLTKRKRGNVQETAEEEGE